MVFHDQQFNDDQGHVPQALFPETHQSGHEEELQPEPTPPLPPEPFERTDELRAREIRENTAVDDGTVLNALRRIRLATIQAPRPTDGTAGEQFIVRRLNVATADTPVQGPNIAVPRGFAVVVRQRNHPGSPVGYIAGSETAVASTDSRAELNDGNALTLNVSSLSQIWVSADSNDVSFELIVEQ